MANSIFAVDGTFFVELGCYIPTFISNPEFMKLLDGEYRAIQKCEGSVPAKVPCLVCDGNDDTYGNFTMKSEAFETLVDQVLQRLDGNMYS